MSDENITTQVGVQASSPMIDTPAEPVNEFASALPEDLRDDPSLKDFKDVGSLAKSYVNAQRMIGQSVRIPGEDASEEARNEFYSKLQQVPGVIRMPSGDNPDEMASFYAQLGRPETPDQYQFELPENIAGDDNLQAEFKQLAHGLGLNTKQAQALVDFQTKQVVQQQEAMTAQRTQAEEILKNQWGGDFDNRLEGAKQVLSVYEQKYGDAVTELMNGPAGNNPALINILSDLATNLHEKGHDGLRAAGNYGITPEDATIQIQEIRNNKAHPYNNPMDPAHEAAKNKVQKLYQIAYPDS